MLIFKSSLTTSNYSFNRFDSHGENLKTIWRIHFRTLWTKKKHVSIYKKSEKFEFLSLLPKKKKNGDLHLGGNSKLVVMFKKKTWGWIPPLQRKFSSRLYLKMTLYNKTVIIWCFITNWKFFNKTVDDWSF